jgi:hypothetical protein
MNTIIIKIGNLWHDAKLKNNRKAQSTSKKQNKRQSKINWHTNNHQTPFWRKEHRLGRPPITITKNGNVLTVVISITPTKQRISYFKKFAKNVKEKTPSTDLYFYKKSPDKGLEPLTTRLKVWRSTDWASRADTAWSFLSIIKIKSVEK